jgi:hypothetical protein
LGVIIEGNKTPEQKAEEAVARKQEQAKQAEIDVKRNAQKLAQYESEKLESIQKRIPKCNSTQAKDTLIKAFDQSQFARTLNLSAIEVSTPQENSFSVTSKTRSCSGILTMNNTEKVTVAFQMTDREDDKFMLTFEVKN